MKFIKGNVILNTNNEFVIEQMKKNGYQEYIETTKDEPVEIPKDETPEITKEETPKTQKKKKK